MRKMNASFETRFMYGNILKVNIYIIYGMGLFRILRLTFHSCPDMKITNRVDRDEAPIIMSFCHGLL